METSANLSGAVPSIAGKYLTFRLSDEEYGVGILKVREIIALQNITPLPKLPPQVKGVINLRGRIIPVIDLRLRLGIRAADYTNQTCIVVTEAELGQEGDVTQIGCIVDSVLEVLSVSEANVEPPPHFGGGLETHYVLGLAKVPEAGRVVVLIDIERVLALDEAGDSLQRLTQETGA